MDSSMVDCSATVSSGFIPLFPPPPRSPLLRSSRRWGYSSNRQRPRVESPVISGTAGRTDARLPQVVREPGSPPVWGAGRWPPPQV